MKKLVLFALAILYYGVSISQTFTIDGLEYEVTSTNPNEVSLTGGTPPTSDLLIPETVTEASITYTVVTIGDSAFESAGLTSVSLASTLRELGEVTFRFNALTEVTIPEGVTSIPQRCFSNNDLTGVVFPTSLETIGFRSFENNEFTSLTLPENVTAIAELAFRNAPLNTINSFNTLPPSVVLGTSDDSFNNEGNIDLTIPPGTEVAYEAGGWIGFNSVNGVVNFEVGDTFSENNFEYEVVSLNPNEVAITGGTTVPQNLIIPENVSIGGSDFVVTAIGDSAFIVSNLTSVSFPSTIRELGEQSFRNNLLTEITIPEGITSIPSNCFSGNDLTSVTFPTSLETIGFRSFESNNLTSLILPENVVSIGQRAFIGSNFNSINSLNATPPSVVLGTSNNDSFGNEQNIDLTVPPGTETAYGSGGWIGFKSVNGVVDFEVGDTFTVNNISYIITSLSPNEVTVTGGTSVPQDLIIPENVSNGGSGFVITTIGDDSFISSSLTDVTLPNTIRVIGNNAFRGNNLTSLNIPNSVTFIDRSAFRDNQLTSVTIPNSVITISNDAFRNNQLTSVVIPDSVTTLKILAFGDNQLTSITLGNSVSTIERDVFDNNPLATVTVLATTPPTTNNDGSSDSFGNRSGIDLFVPEDSVAAYIDSGQWDGFNSITGITIDITVAPKVFLQGASLNPIAGEEDLMRDSLRENNLLPTMSPYGDGATVAPTVFDTTGANAIVDWVRVELRTGVDSDNTTVVNSTAAFVQRDGDIVGLDGSSSITFTEEEGDYFIAIIHRNHIGILAAVPAPLSNTATALDFTQDITSAKGENLALTALVNGTFAMIAGDADGSSQILNTDITEGLTLAGGGEGYSSADADMNGFVLNSDIQLLILGNSGTVQQFD